jgi:hypothetical protein
MPDKAPPMSLGPIPMENNSSLYDYKFDVAARTWQLWVDTIPALTIAPGSQFSDIIIPTKVRGARNERGNGRWMHATPPSVFFPYSHSPSPSPPPPLAQDSARYTFLLDLALQHDQPVLLVGPTGTGKSVYINQHLVQDLPKDKWTPVRGNTGRARMRRSGFAVDSEEKRGGGTCLSADSFPLTLACTHSLWHATPLASFRPTTQVFITMSARTTANMVQDQVDGRLDKRKKGVYGKQRRGTLAQCIPSLTVSLTQS